MIKMAVRQGYGFGGQALYLQIGVNNRRLIAGIDEKTRIAVFFVDDVAIGLVVSQREDVDF